MNEKEPKFVPEKLEKENFEMRERIEEIGNELKEKTVDQRNHFRMNPELGLAPETAKYVVEVLKSLGYEIKKGIAETGVVATLKGEKEATVVAFKGNLDAVPVKDGIDEPFKSQKAGVSHTCGHAGEMAAMLGAAEILSKIPANERGTIKLIFQPNEERLVKPESYALKMVNEGALEGIDAVIELHPTTLFSEDTFLSAEGRLNAASGRYKVMVHPKEEDVLKGKSLDAHTLLSLVTTKMGKHEPRPEQLKDVLVRTTFHVSSEKKTLKELAEEFGVLPQEFFSFKVVLKGPGGHAGVSREAPNLNLISAEIISKLYEKYGNSLFSFSKSAGKPAYNVLTTQTELWVSVKGRSPNEFQKDLEGALTELVIDPVVEKEYHQEEIDKVPFASQAESWSTVRIGTNDYFGPRKDIFHDLRLTLEEEVKKAGLVKPKFVEGAGEEMPCPEGEWRLYYQKGTPPQFNSSELIKLIDQAAKEFGITKLNKEPLTAGSDFCYMQQPGIETALVAWGCVPIDKLREYKRQKIGHHHPRFIESPKSVVRISKIIARIATMFWEKKT
jgi:metal-dependent amidase/aminoacylase/carboxypeptidase family protein